MKNLKFLGVLLVSFIIFSFSVNAETINKDFTLEKESTTFIEVEENANVVIDLNGQSLTVRDSHAIIVNKGATVTITGNGVVNAKKAAILNKGGNVTIENGTFASIDWYTIKNLGTMTIEGGTFGQTEDNGGNSSLIANGWYKSVDEGIAAPDKSTETEAKALMTINGGTFNHFTTTVTIKSDDWSKTVINGGNFKSENGRLVQATGEVLITNGNFVGYNDISLLNGDKSRGYQPATITITGGTYSAKSIVWPYTSGTLTITGGTFNDIKSVINTEKEGEEATYVISGGTFAIDVNEFINDGLYATKNGDVYEVGKPSVKPDIAIIDPEKTEAVKEVEVGLVESEKIEEVLSSSLEKNPELKEKTKGISVKVNIDINPLKEEDASSEVKTAMNEIKEKAGKATIAHFFDISILVRNTNNDAHIGNISELTEEIELMVLLPDSLKNNDTKVNRNYFILREHDGKIDTIKAELSKDGKYLVFKTNKFSTYALAYEDSPVENIPEVPKTLDGITKTVVISTISLISLAGIALYLKKQAEN